MSILFAIRRDLVHELRHRLKPTQSGWDGLRFFSRSAVACKERTQNQDGLKSLYVVNIEGQKTTSPILIGLMENLQRLHPRVGFFQPVAAAPAINSDTGAPGHIDLFQSAFKLQGEPRKMWGLTRRESLHLLAAGKEEELLERVYTAYDKYQEDFDFVLVEGTSHEGSGLDLNARLAATLGSPVLMEIDAGLRGSALTDKILIAQTTVEAEHAQVAGVLVNRAARGTVAGVRFEIRERLEKAKCPLVGVLPEDPLLSSLRLDEISAAIGGKLVAGNPALMDTDVSDVLVGSADLNHLMDYVEECQPGRPLVVFNASRTDLLLGLFAINIHGRGPYLAGLLITDEEKMEPRVKQILKAASDSNAGSAYHLPVISTKLRTHDVNNIIGKLAPSILPSSIRKIEESKTVFAHHVDSEAIERLLSAPRERLLTPKAFLHSINRMCTAEPQRIVLPESSDARVLTAATELTRRGLAKVILLGQPDAVNAQAAKLALNLTGCEIVDPANSPNMERYVEALCEARKEKGMTPKNARDLLADINYFGTVMALCGDADGMVSGAIHTTAATIRPGLQVLKMPGALVSSIFFMCLPDKVLVYGDCAVNVNPDAAGLARIATTSADTAKAFGIEPLVALLSYSTLGSGSGPEVDRVIEAVRLAREMRPDLAIEGPIQYDAAVDPAVAAVKIKGGSAVAGKATVCVFPDLNTGNNTYKAVQQSTGALAIGPIMQGFKRPVNDLSRGCTVGDIVNTVTATSIQALGMKAKEAAAAAAAAAPA